MREQALAKQNTSAASSTLAVGGLLQRKCACGTHTGGGGQCAACSKSRTLQRRTAHAREQSDAQGAVLPLVHDVLRSSGRPLDEPTRTFMEARFGHDFGQVRVHTDTRAAASATAVNALAYSVGRDVVFGAGQYAPGTDAGRKLLAHELTHVMQQRSAAGASLGHLQVGSPDSAFEAEAESSERSAPARVSASSTPLMQRKGKFIDSPDAPAVGRCGTAWSCATTRQACGAADNPIMGPMARSNWWKLTVKIDTEAPTEDDVMPDTIGHTYVEFSESNGAVYTYGFYPRPDQRPDFGHFWVPGCMVHPDTAHQGCVDYDEPFMLTEAEHRRALDTAQTMCYAPEYYDLLKFNCTSFANLIVRQAGKSLPAIRGMLGARVGGRAWADNPNTLLKGLRERDAARAAGQRR
ncbi:MAG: DUF4157 domain-containing protein [Pyrinomonadaceae bacterium]